MLTSKKTNFLLLLVVLALLWVFVPGASTVRVNLTSIPEAQSFRLPVGSGRHHVYVFESLDCAYCAKLHPELNRLRDATIHILPLPGHSPTSRTLAANAWCAADRPGAWTEAFKGVSSNGPACASSPLEMNLALAKSLGLRSTPAIIFGDGSTHEGYLSAAQMQERIDSIAHDLK